MNSLSKSGDQFAEQEDQIADQISTMKQRYIYIQIKNIHNIFCQNDSIEN